MGPDKKWAVIKVEDLEKDLNRNTWHLYGYEVFQVLSSPDRIVFKKKAKP